MAIHRKPQYAFLGAVIGGLGAAIGGASQANATNAANKANLEFQKEQYEYEKGKQAPYVQGAQAEIANTGQFAPFTQGTQTGAARGQLAGLDYLGDTRRKQLQGIRGDQAIGSLADTSSAQDLIGQAGAFSDPYTAALYDRGAGSINAEHDRQRKLGAIANVGSGSALSGQAARSQAGIEGARSSALGQLGQDVGREAWKYGIGEAKDQRNYQLGLANQLQGVGQTGLNNAVTGSNLTASAGQAGVNAPFQPFNAYANTVNQGGSLPNVTTRPNASPLAAGIGAGLAGYNAFANQGGQ